MSQLIAPAEALAGLPDELRMAQHAIETDEVQAILKTLSKYNLGIFMPHMHTDSESFTVLPEGTVQIEDELKVSFARRGTVNSRRMIPVAWRWERGGAQAVSDCAGKAEAAGWCHCSG